ncbi:hypothetical protein CPLU01_08182 [Colletotrichum plurivorum]|uniref:Uncharacterized protein n=1 Tax=Colletotrichum plurivorum TaxID=2175906 RepID=A0A8H6KCL5_9PEZI|nr:hypothetical protein CPLU01_08182 [Colletotrichum plurivorum]
MARLAKVLLLGFLLVGQVTPLPSKGPKVDPINLDSHKGPKVDPINLDSHKGPKVDPINLDSHKGPKVDPINLDSQKVDLDPIVPKVIWHGPLTDAELAKLHDDLKDGEGLEPSPEEDRELVLWRSQDPLSESLIKVERQDGMVSVTVDRINSARPNAPRVCDPEVTLYGPMQSIRLFTSSHTPELFQVNVTNVFGNSSGIASSQPGLLDSGLFNFDPQDPITDFFVFTNGDMSSYHGLNFTTSKGRTFSSMSDFQGKGVKAYRVPVGSGILGRFRAAQCGKTGHFGLIGFDFIEEIESVTITHIKYHGFNKGVMPAGRGKLVVLGSQVLDNRNSSIEQALSIQSVEAVMKQWSITLTTTKDYTASLALGIDVEIPFLFEAKATTTTGWGLHVALANGRTEATTTSHYATANLRCPARKYCVGSSFFNTWKLDVQTEVTLRARTRTGDFFWVQKGRYQGSEGAAIQLRVDEADTVIEKPSHQ